MSERLAIPVMPWANRRAESFTDVEVEAWKAQIPALQEQLSAYSVRRSELRAECIRLARLLAPDWDRGRLVKHLERNLPKGYNGVMLATLAFVALADPTERLLGPR